MITIEAHMEKLREAKIKNLETFAQFMIVFIIAPKSDSWKQSGVYNNTALHMFVLRTSPSEFQSLYTLGKAW